MNLKFMSKNEKEPVDFIKHYVKPHRKVSREVTPEDINKVITDAYIMYNLCYTQHGYHRGAHAIAHAQINNTDPLRFFVTSDKRIILNPVITNKTKVEVFDYEGCLSFPESAPVKVGRSNKITVSFDEIDSTGAQTFKENVQLSGKEAKVYQHEIDHMNGKYIYKTLKTKSK